MSDSDDIAKALEKLRAGDRSALEELLPHIYEDLRRLARGLFRDVPDGFTLQPTALVHEAYVRLAGSRSQAWESRKHFFSVAAKAMRQVLADHARAHLAAKRGGAYQRVTLSGAEDVDDASTVDLVALHEALESLREHSERHANIAELRFLTGCSVAEVAAMLELSERTVKSGWRAARAFLRDALREDDA